MDIMVKKFLWKTLHVCKTQPINSLFCWFLDFCHKITENMDVIGEMAFIFAFSRRKANWILKTYSWEFFLQASVSSAELCWTRFGNARRCLELLNYVGFCFDADERCRTLLMLFVLAECHFLCVGLYVY